VLSDIVSKPNRSARRPRLLKTSTSEWVYSRTSACPRDCLQWHPFIHVRSQAGMIFNVIVDKQREASSKKCSQTHPAYEKAGSAWTVAFRSPLSWLCSHTTSSDESLSPDQGFPSRTLWSKIVGRPKNTVVVTWQQIPTSVESASPPRIRCLISGVVFGLIRDPTWAIFLFHLTGIAPGSDSSPCEIMESLFEMRPGTSHSFQGLEIYLEWIIIISVIAAARSA